MNCPSDSIFGTAACINAPAIIKSRSSPTNDQNVCCKAVPNQLLSNEPAICLYKPRASATSTTSSPRNVGALHTIHADAKIAPKSAITPTRAPSSATKGSASPASTLSRSPTSGIDGVAFDENVPPSDTKGIEVASASKDPDAPPPPNSPPPEEKLTS